MVIAPIVTSTDKFSYFKKNKTFVAEASQFSLAQHEMFFSCAYNDACDVGFYMVSAKTGRKALFIFRETLRDRDGDIVKWVWDAADPELEGVTVQIFND
jgi:hypothetical protein